MKPRTDLGDWIAKRHACKEGYKYASRMTLNRFWKQCNNGCWMLWVVDEAGNDALVVLRKCKRIGGFHSNHYFEDGYYTAPELKIIADKIRKQFPNPPKIVFNGKRVK